MASTTMKSQCATCEKHTGIFICGGCNRAFCAIHANEHRQFLGQQIDEIVLEHDLLRQSINEQIQPSSMKDIDQWERESFERIHRIAQHAREELKRCMKERIENMQPAMQQLKEKLNQARREDDFFENDLKHWSGKIDELKTIISMPIPIVFKSINDDLIQFHPEVHINNSLVVQPKDQVNPISSFAIKEEYFHPRVIELSKTTGGLGFRIKGGQADNVPIYVSRIIPNSVAWKHGGLKKGDRLLSVNGVSVENEYHEKVVNLLKQAQGNVKLLVRYSPQGFSRMNEDFSEDQNN